MSGLIHIYCGDGKGKTTAAMGLALRVAGSGKKVLLLQFLKDGKSSEFAALTQVAGMEAVPWTLSPEERAEAEAYYTGLMEAAFARAGDLGLLVLDEVLDACAAGMTGEDRLLALIRQRPADLEVVLTGRKPSQALLDAADYVTEMRKVKHPYERGVAARLGIEY